jgi:hypothetical protein
MMAIWKRLVSPIVAMGVHQRRHVRLLHQDGGAAAVNAAASTICLEVTHTSETIEQRRT